MIDVVKIITLALLTLFLSCKQNDNSYHKEFKTVKYSEFITGINRISTITNPSFEIAKNGRYWAAWNSNISSKSDSLASVTISTSNDDGKTWKEFLYVVPVKNRVKICNPKLWIDPDKKLWIFITQNSKIWALTTNNPENENPTWNDPSFLSNGSVTGNPVLLSNGECIVPIVIKSKTAVLSSKDHGRSWQIKNTISMLNKFVGFDQKNMIIEKTDASLWMIANNNNNIWEGISTDNGYTWEELKPKDIEKSCNPLFLKRLLSGKLLMVKQVSALNEPNPSSLLASISQDEGKTWVGNFNLSSNYIVSNIGGQQEDNKLLPCCATINIIFNENDKTVLASFNEDDVLYCQHDTTIIPVKNVVSSLYEH